MRLQGFAVQIQGVWASPHLVQPSLLALMSTLHDADHKAGTQRQAFTDG